MECKRTPDDRLYKKNQVATLRLKKIKKRKMEYQSQLNYCIFITIRDHFIIRASKNFR